MSLTEIHEMIVDAEVAEMEKMAEDDAAQRIMARGFMDELNKLAGQSAAEKALATASAVKPPTNPWKQQGYSSRGEQRRHASGLKRQSVKDSPVPSGQQAFGPGRVHKTHTIRPEIEPPPANTGSQFNDGRTKAGEAIDARVAKGEKRMDINMYTFRGRDSGLPRHEQKR